jgi:hypothetical protein
MCACASPPILSRANTEPTLLTGNTHASSTPHDGTPFTHLRMTLRFLLQSVLFAGSFLMPFRLSFAVEEIAGPEQLAQLLIEAKSISFTGLLPEFSTTKPPDAVKRLEIRRTVHHMDEIKTLSTFFRTSNFQPDAEMTDYFKKGGKLDAAYGMRVVIDDKYSFEVVSMDLAVFAHSLTFRFHRLDGRDDIPRVLSFFLKDIPNSSQ